MCPRGGGATPSSPSSSWPSNEPRATMAEEIAAGASLEQPEELTMGRLIGHSIGSSVAAMKEHEAGLGAGEDPDHVRKTRVAVRRLRSNLRTFGDFLDPSKTGPVVEELAVLAAT